MPIFKEIISPTGNTLNYHKVKKIEFVAETDLICVTVFSYANESIYIESSGNSLSWVCEHKFQSHLLSTFSESAIDNMLISVFNSPFYQGTVIDAIQSLDSIKVRKWAIIKQIRNSVEMGSFNWNNLLFNSDYISQSRIQGATQLATLALMNQQPFVIEWTLADNTVQTLDAEQMISVGQAMANHINECHIKARALRQQIEAATTKEEVEAVTWN